VKPGTYKVRLTFGDQMDSTDVEVKYDPRLEMPTSAINASYTTLKDLEGRYSLGVQAVDRLKESIKIAKSIQKDLKEKDKEGYKDQLELTQNTLDTLNSMLDIFLGEKDERQGITRNQPDNVNTYYATAYWYTSGGLHAPGVTETKLIKKFENELTKVLGMVNGYYAEEWPKFREAVEKLDTSPFKEYEEIK